MIATGHHLPEADIVRGYDALAHDFVMCASFYAAVLRFVGTVRGLRVLDAGCGSGVLLPRLADAGGAEVHGLELSPQLCRVAEAQLGARGQVHCGSLLASWPFPADYFDLVLMTEVIEHLPNPGFALMETRRVLRWGGRAVITFPNASAYEPFFGAAQRREGRGRWGAFLPWEHPRKTRQPIDTVYTYDEIQALLRGGGMVPTRIRGREAFPYLWDWQFIEPRRPLRVALQALERLRPLASWILNGLGRRRRCYRLFIECQPASALGDEPTGEPGAGLEKPQWRMDTDGRGRTGRPMPEHNPSDSGTSCGGPAQP
jgi:SAM-dependent methyltransferase